MTLLNNEEERERWISFVQRLNPEIDPIAISLMDQLRFVARSLYHASAQSLEGIALSLAQYKLLMHLFFAEQMGDRLELNPSEISSSQGVSRNTTSSLIRELEEKGLIERRLDPDDRRRFNISLSGEGRALVLDHARQHLAQTSSCFTVLNEEEQATLSMLLHKVGAHVEKIRS